ncbi:hypothetical protein Ancab_037970 [Ancistrocladus abbreviatus]
MAESSKVRLVRCPKCQNLLPELPDYSIYQCGGCGAVLRAKKCDAKGEKVSERSNEEKVRVVSEKSENFAGKSENFPGKEMVSGVENGGEDGVNDSDGSSRIIAERCCIDSKGLSEKGIVENDNIVKNDVGNEDIECQLNDLKRQPENVDGSRSSGRIFRRGMQDRGEVGSFGGIRRDNFEVGRLPGSGYAGEGTSRSRWDCNYSSVFMSENQNDTSKLSRVELAANREELLRKLDELKDQLSRTCDVNEKTAERIPIDQRVVHPEPYADYDELFHDLASGFSRGSRQLYAPNKHAIRPHYFDHRREPLSVRNRSEMTMHDSHASMPNSNFNPRYEDPIGHHILRRPPPHRISAKHQYQTAHAYLSSHYLGGELDPFEPYPCDPILNQPSCSCYHCHENNQQVPVQIPTPTSCNRRLLHVANKPISCHHEIPGAFGPQVYDSRICNAPPVGSCDPQSHARWPCDLNFELGGFTRSRPQRVVLYNDGCHCHPVAGGAPFIMCHNCFELLKLPKKVFQVEKSQWRICCGACSSVISLAIVDEKLVSVNKPTKQTPTEALDSSNEVVFKKPFQSRGPTKLDSSSFRSDDYDNSGYDFQSIDKDPNSSDNCQGLNSSKSEELQNLCSLSPSSSENEDFPDDFVSRHGENNAPEMPVKITLSPPPSGSPLEEHFDYSSKYHAVNRCGKGNLSSRSDQERVITNKSTLRQNSLKESLETEVEISPNDYPNTGATQDTADASTEEDQTRSKKGVDSFLAGLIKKSFRDFSRTTQHMENGKRNVTVNGHVIPDRLVKKAEKLAGSICPGQYWYDYRAGFWGAMGGPCLGIIPPYIEEFNHPMPENCAAGNTSVFVNGRELHQKDLDLLASRGLPVNRDRSYIIEISGRVLDEDSGEELDSLGKLAPTVEKVKHGFGMRVPKAAA